MAFIREQVLADLKTNICTVGYTKVSGEPATLRGTLRDDALPPAKAEGTTSARTPDENLITIFDVDKQGWRSFRFSNMQTFQVG